MSFASAPQLITATLEEYGALTRVALCEYLRSREPRRHLYTPLADYPQRGGRMLRPSLCIAVARAFGAPAREAVHAAAALELLHNAFLIHDDVEDESELRRGRPTLHALHGVPMAVNVGDALTLLSIRALLDSRFQLGERMALQLLEEAERMARESVEGQAIELGWRRDNAPHLGDGDYLQMVLKKTCWYTTIYPSRVGALIGTRGRFPLERLIRFGFFLGAAFQIQDDLLNLAGDPLQYGKEIGGDLLEGKRTLMLIHAIRESTASERERLLGILGIPRAARTREQLGWMHRQLQRCGSLEHAQQTAHGLAGAALHEFSRVFAELPDSRDRRFIEGLARWVLART